MDVIRDVLLRRQPYPIDIHHHIIPDFYVEALEEFGVTTSFGLSFPDWSVQSHLGVMDTVGIATGITSISTPGVYFKDDAFSRDLARRCNEFSGRMISDHPRRFGGFASLPLPDVDGALHELEYALDTLQLDGVVLMSNVSGRYPGDPAYEAVLSELNRRKAIIYIHPHDPPDHGIPQGIQAPVDTALETTRAVMSLMYSGALERFPDLRIILSHAGGIVPYLARRIALGRFFDAAEAPPDKGMPSSLGRASCQTEGIRLLKNLYYDTMSASGYHDYRALQELVDPAHILYGSDFSWLPSRLIPIKAWQLSRYDGFDRKTLQAIERDNALLLFPRFREVH